MIRATLIVLAVSAPAMAQETTMYCAARDVALSKIVEFEELPMSRGIAQDGSMVEIFANPANGNWTMAFTAPNTGITCFPAYGQGWSDAKPKGKPA